MKIKKIVLILAIQLIGSTAISFTALAQTPFVAKYEPEVLGKIVQRVKDDVKAGIKPVIVLDLDDTLFNSNSRKVVLFRQFADRAEIQAKYPNETEKLRQVTESQVTYFVQDTLTTLGISNATFATEANDFVMPLFLSDTYCALDEEISGASRYVGALYDAGAHLAYVTGRDGPSMGRGTSEDLRRLHFPIGSDAELLMKPNRSIPDLDFKRKSFQAIALEGDVVGAFENEPANVNAYLDYFPNVTAVMLDTIRAGNPATVRPEVHWVKDFLGVW